MYGNSIHKISHYFIPVLFTFVVNGQVADSLRLNEIRILASHNSYKKKPDPKIIAFLAKHKQKLGPENDPIQLDYGHLPLSDQFDQYNIRGIELDVYADSKGGKFSKRKINGLIKGLPARSRDTLLREKGFKILHISDVDYETHYPTFRSALQELRDWSLRNRDHLPIFIQVEAKGSGLGDESKLLRFLGFSKAEKFNLSAFERLNQELIEEIPNELLFTPADLKGNHPTIMSRLQVEGWPILSACRGKLFFILDGSKSVLYKEKLSKEYDCPMFVYGEAGEPTTAFIKRDDPIGLEEEIATLSEHYIIRTRSDAGTIEARNNDYSRWESALQSKAQIISTDYYRADPAIGTFSVSLKEAFLKRKP